MTHAVNLERRSPRVRYRRGPRVGRRRPKTANPGITAGQRFGLYLSVAREQAGLTQAELGEMVGLAESSICNIEAGRRGARGGHRAAFIAALNLDGGDLLRYLNPDPVETSAAVDAPRFLEPEPLFDLEACRDSYITSQLRP